MYHIIINPSSRSGKGLKLWKEVIEPALMAEKADYLSYFSKKAGDVERLAGEITSALSQDALSKSQKNTLSASTPYPDSSPTLGQDLASSDIGRRDVLIILGGDGTMNEALQGIKNPSDILLGYIPTGSSNDLARDLGLSKDPRQALNRILHPARIHLMDLGILTLPDGKARRFVVSSGVGFDAAVCEGVLHSSLKRVFNQVGLGKLIYLAIALKQLFQAKAVSCDLSLDEQPPIHFHRILFIASMIHRYEGGGFRFCPDAKDQDGILNLCAVGDLPKLLILLALPTAFVGKHYLFRGVEAYHASRIHISTSVPLCVHTDGEVPGHYSELTLECKKEALRILL